MNTPSHNDLYISSHEVPAFKTRINADPLLQNARDRIIQKAEQALQAELKPESYAIAGSGQHGNYQAVSHQAQNIIESTSFAYLLTDDIRFANRATQALCHFATYEVWTGREFANRDPAWFSALETARFVQTYAASINWLGNALSDADKKTALDGMTRLGVEPLIRDWVGPEGRVHALDSMGHNWWMVCVAAAGVGALALRDHDPRAEQWVHHIVEGIPEFFSYAGNILQNKMPNFDPDGGFYESLGYTNYTLVHYAYLQAALQRIYPNGLNGQCFDQIDPMLTHMAEFMTHFTYPTQHEQPSGNRHYVVDFGDQHRDHAFSADVALYLARTTRNGRYRWYFDRYIQHVNNPYQMLFYDPTVQAQPPHDLPTSRVLKGIGWAALRDHWNDDPKLLAIKCGDTWNHAHHDAGSFVIYADGEPLLIDSGACSYGRPEYGQYYLKPQSHNLVLPAGKVPPSDDLYRGIKFRGQLHDFIPDPNVRHVMADATGPFANLFRRYFRHFLWLDDVIVIIDDLLAYEPTQFEWLFHGETPPTCNNNTLHIQGKKAALQLDILFPKNLQANIQNGHPHHEPDQTLTYLSLQNTDTTPDAKFLGIIRTGNPMPNTSITPLSGSEWMGAQINQWKLYVNIRADGRRMHRNSNLTIDGWETDAFLFAVNPTQTLIIGGSYLRSPDKTIVFNSLSKGNAYLHNGRIHVQGPSGTHVRVQQATHVTTNNRDLPANAIYSDPPFQVFKVI